MIIIKKKAVTTNPLIQQKTFQTMKTNITRYPILTGKREELK